ncbi:MAG: UDP-2,4-diacetamido-2,4,6-trideoxy-beta-L-altropyranose hydrolase [Lachnospiraceae bacterium]|nr:UDP-2,4-diacetamido-2,4,6-trideoxy-beta-L-altropyranose hydrolase [Lachnospiraceae bacterium]
MNKTPIVWIRADGNSEIASGHLRRCLSIADALSERGARVIFLVADEMSAELLRKMAGRYFTGSSKLENQSDAADPGDSGGTNDVDSSGSSRMEMIVLHTDYHKPKTDGDALTVFYRKCPPDFLLIDSYFMKAEDFTRLNAILPDVPIGYIDDLAACDPAVDLLINYGANPPESFYRAAKKCLFGPMFAPLRDQFAKAGSAYAVRDRVERILLTTGGTDPYGMAERIIRGIAGEKVLASVRIAWVQPSVSGGNDGRSMLESGEMIDRDPRVEIHRQVTQMADLMAFCDLAVSAGGTTLYELCAVGVPTVAFSMADNQQSFAGRLAETGAITCVGDVRPMGDQKQFDSAEETAVQIVSWLAAQANDTAGRRQISEKMRALTDGRGAGRIAEEILSIKKVQG